MRPTTIAVLAMLAVGWMLGGVGGREAEATVDLTLPHFKCYLISGHNPPHVVRVIDQFGQETIHVGKARLLCTPVLEKIVVEGVPAPFSGDHLKCYNIPLAERHDPPAVVDLANQFGIEEGVAVGLSRFLCAPTEKKVRPGAAESE
jgi:hypothetical protein